MCCFFFFFSSRRRHTRWNCDWSSDVCSSDLLLAGGDDYELLFTAATADREAIAAAGRACCVAITRIGTMTKEPGLRLEGRSEERRVGKECRSRWETEDEREKHEVQKRETARR